MEQYLQISLLVLVVVQLVSRTLCVNMPSKMPQGMYCEGCIATVTELVKRVNKPSLDSREVRVVEAFEKICDYSNFDTYAYSPPKTAKACSFLLDNYDEDIETLLLKTSDQQALEKEVCYKLTEACEGVDRSKKPKEETEVKFNDENVDVSQSSPFSEQSQDPNFINLDLNDEGGIDNAVNKLNGVLGNIAANSNQGGDEDEDEEDQKRDNAEKSEL